MTQPEKWEPRTELPTPLQLINDMDRVLFFAKRGTKAVDGLRKTYLQRKHEYLGAFESRKLDLRGKDGKLSLADRESQARLDHWDLFVAMNEAEAEFQFARDKLNDLEKELSKAQTESRLVMAELNLSR